MFTITIEEAQARLPELIEQLQPGSEIIILRNQQPVAKLTVQPPASQVPRQPGTLKGTVLYMAPDFDAPLDEFKLS